MIKKSIFGASAICSAAFTFIPENLFGLIEWFTKDSFKRWPSIADSYGAINIVVTRILCFIVAAILCAVGYAVFLWLRRWKTIKGNNFVIRIEYGNLLAKKKFWQKPFKRVINFDECYTTTVGNRPEDINSTSICGQYLADNPNLNVNTLIGNAGIKKAIAKSKFQKRDRYESGTLVPNGNDLLLAFAKLDERGKGYLTRDEYLKCLDKLWEEIECHYGQNDVCIPVLGAGTTIINGGSGASIPQQELLDMIIASYKLSSHKIKAPNKLRIVCRKNAEFSINKIEG